MAQDTIFPVLIVGAGPAGLVAALMLRQNGVPVRIIEKEETIRNIGQRGAGIMPRTFELFKSMGIVDDVLSQAMHLHPMRMYDPPATFYMEKYVEPTPFRPYTNMMMLAQARSERILRTHLARFGCKIELGATLKDFKQGEENVEAHVVKREGGREITEIIRCRWLVGADGAKSVVRKQLGLAFDGESWPYPMIIGDLEIKGVDGKYWHNWGNMGSVLLGLRSTEEEGVFHMMLGGNVDLEKVAARPEVELEHILKKAIGRTDIQLERVRLISIWRPHSRMVETFRVGRVFVVGDAAHVHTPFGGQGLNTSMQDAANLSWKLSLVAKGLASPSLLNTYAEERAPVVAEVLKASSELFINFTKAQAIGASHEVAWKRSEELHQLDVHCRWSSIVIDERSPKETIPVDPYGRKHLPTDIVRAGDRAPNAPGLVILSAAKEAGIPLQTTSLFDVFKVSHHTVLIFSDESDKAERVTAALKMYPAELLQVVFIHATAAGTDSSPSDTAYLGVLDRDGHAHEGYQVQTGRFTLVIVRPDGIVGGIVFGGGGVRRYFDCVFSALRDPKIRGLL